MMQQYLQIKSQHEDSILFFRLGDFYEMFYEDAKLASEELDLVLTGKDCGQEERAPMCGVPYHSCEGYISRLVSRGYKVAICEQVENPATAKGLVKRDVVRIITPGTVLADSMLEEGKNNYLAAIDFKNGAYGVCFADASTGEMSLIQIDGEQTEKRVIGELGRFSPREIIIQKALKENVIIDFCKERLNAVITEREESSFDIRYTLQKVLNQFDVISTKSIGIDEEGVSASVLGAAIEYLQEMGGSDELSVNKVDVYTENEFMRLDLNAIRNLEITETMRQKAKKGSLLWVLDKTKTAMGKRLMHSWVEKPLVNIPQIILRQNAVEELVGNTLMQGELRNAFVYIKDIERLISRAVYGTVSPKELRTLGESLVHLPEIKDILSGVQSRLLGITHDEIDLLEDIKELILSAIKENPPFSSKEGGLINDGYNEQVDELRKVMQNASGYISEIEARERERTGIKNLRVKYNKVFGYHIEVTNSFLDKVPEDYQRKQTLTNCERFITDELKNLEARILGAKETINNLEYEIFSNVRKATADEVLRFQKTAAALARLDVLCSFAQVAVENSYNRPKINNDGVVNIIGGRHPVVEKVLKSPFVSNDTYLDLGDSRCAVITGPNMAGKSTYMRQVAIITLMAQIGSFVPAQSADIGIVDAIFTRVGASDDLASGQSTFMVEMNEVAEIIQNATRNSLIILDEIGRGTSTFDGMAIAKAVLEFLVDKKKLGAKTLFATHYHELTQMEKEMSGIKNYNIAVKKRGDDIIFLRRIVPGGADDSYGIEVAKLAGVPDMVIKRAKVVLSELLEGGLTVYKTEKTTGDSQLSFETINAQSIYEELRVLDVDTLTPIESMKILYDLAEKAKSL